MIMKTLISRCRGRMASWAVAALLVGLSGCMSKYIVWSPDGRWGAVLSDEGMRICDASGGLSPVLLPGVVAVDWLSDSERLVLVRGRVARDWAELEPLLDPEGKAQVVREGTATIDALRDGASWGVASLSFETKSPQLLWLKAHHGEMLRDRLTLEEWSELESSEVGYLEAVTARWDGERLTVGRTLLANLDGIGQARVAPGDGAVAFTFGDQGGEESFRIRVAVLGERGGTAVVSEKASAYPEWTADGQSLLYARPASSEGVGDVSLGTLVQQRVFDEQGELAGTDGEVATALAGLVFSPWTRVRRLADGRILFNAVPVSLPVSAADAKVEGDQLFALDLERQTTLVPLVPRHALADLPEALSWFEPSPDGRLILFGAPNGSVAIFKPSTGEVVEVQAGVGGDDGGDLLVEPAWRGNDSVVYTRLRRGTGDGAEPAGVEVVEMTEGRERVLSDGWPASFLEGFVD